MGGFESLSTNFILWLQSFSTPALDSVFKLITFLGDEKFYLILLPLVYWCFDKRLGLRLALVVLLSDTINLWCKWGFGLPRPDPARVRYIKPEDGPGFPSGHTQAVTVAFGYAASQLQRWAVHVVAATLVFLVALSRMYLGVHHVYDVLGALVIGYLVLFAFVKATPLAARRWRAWPSGLRYALAAGLPVLLFAIWPLEDTAGSLGALAGFAVGGLFEAERVHFSAAGAPAQRVLRFLLGFVVLGGLYFGLSALPLEGAAWRFVRYALVGLFGAGVAPWLFVRLRLARAEVPAAQVATTAGS